MHKIQKIESHPRCAADPDLKFNTLRELWEHFNSNCSGIKFKCGGCSYSETKVLFDIDHRLDGNDEEDYCVENYINCSFCREGLSVKSN